MSADIEKLHSILLTAISEDPDLQVKTLIAVQLAQRNNCDLLQLSKSPNPEVREIVALSLQGYPNKVEILAELLIWYEGEKDEATLEKLFSTISLILQTITEVEILQKASSFLEKMVEEENLLNYSLRLLGYCSLPIVENIYLEKLNKYRFNNKVRKNIFLGIHNLVKKRYSLSEIMENKLIEVVSTTYEPPEVRSLCLEVLSQTKKQRVVDLLELVIETDHNALLRKHCIEIIGKWQIIELSTLLIDKLRYDGISDVRAACALSLGEIASFEALPDLSEALELDPSFFVREAAAEALGRLKSQQALAALLKGLEDHDSYVRSTSAWSIEQLTPDPELISKICKVAGSTGQEVNIRAGMISVLAKMNSSPVAANCLIHIFRTDKSPIREIVIEALENFVSSLREDSNFLDTQLPFILEEVVTSESFSLRAAICTFLGHLKVDSTFSFLLDRLVKDEDALVRRQAAWGISNLRPNNRKKKIYALIKEKSNKNIVPLFLDILTAWYDLEDISLAFTYLDPSYEVEWRIRAVELLTSIISSDELELDEEITHSIMKRIILILKKDPASNVRAASAYALGHFSVNEEYDNVIIPVLIEAIKTERIYTVRELASQALGFRGRGDSEITKELYKLIQYKFEKDPSIRYFAALALLNYEEQLGKNME
ncbi:MAG: HEAT repeat domain-containing protein [Candidatus Hodarchaeales archaeon]